MPLFAGSTRSELKLVSELTTRLMLPAGKVLARRGQRPRCEFVIVLDGTAEARRDDRLVEQIGTGSHFGEIGLIRGIREPATVTASADMTVDVVGVREFRTLYSLLDAFRVRVTHELDRRIASWITTGSPLGAAPMLVERAAPTVKEGV